MKKTQQLFIIISFLLSIGNSLGQANFRCDLPTISGPSLPSPSVTTCGKFLENFIPNPAGPNDTIDLNFIFFKPGSAGIYIPANITLPIIQTMVANLNNQWTNLDPPHLPTSPPAAVLTDSKIRFKLKNLSLITDSMAYIYNSNVAFLTPYRDTTAIDIFWCYDTYTAGPGCGGGGNGGFGLARMGLCGSQTPAGMDGLVGHEIGHALGLDHPFVGTSAGSLLLHGGPAYVPPILDLNIAKEIAVRDTARNCYPINDSSSNNIVSYNWKCRSYLSPEQVAGIRYLLRSTGPTNDFLKPNQSICNVNHAKDSTYTSNQVWNTNKFIDGDIVIDSNVKISVSCQIWMRQNSKVIVKPGGKLVILKGGSFQSVCEGMWKGIEVWGNAAEGQYIESTNGMPMYQGMVEMFGGTIRDAVVGVTLGKRDSLGNPVSGSGGGIIQANDSSLFVNNSIGAEFFPYSFVSRNPLYNQNSSFFATSSFSLSTALGYSGFKTNTGNVPLAYVLLNDVHLVKFFGCQFNSTYSGGLPYGIKGVNASIDMRDYCSADSANVCTGTLIRNKFLASSVSTGCGYAIYLTNYLSYMPSLIDHVDFGASSSKGAVYLSNVTQAQITNCLFGVTIGNSSITRYGIYLDNCTGYKVENNSFSGSPSSTITIAKNVGIYVNNSGPYANSIYNNTFLNLDQGLWAQNQNVDWTTQIGLKMNCNDFTTCKYDIGVQKGGRYATFVPNNTGIDYTQGIANPFNEPDNVRNTYNVVSCNTNAENKFYVNSSNTFFTNHGSFLGSQFHPTPHANKSCSDSLEIIDIIGNLPASSVKSSYCPSVFTPTFSNSMLNASATNQRELILAYSDTLATKVDGGNTTSLLATVNSGTVTWVNLKNTLVAVGPYLSDEVMLAYFTLNPPSGHVGQVHEVNAPVSPIVYNFITTMSLPTATLTRINENQDTNLVSARRLLEAKLNLARTELGFIHNEKTRRFLADSTVNPVDSLIAIVQEGITTNTVEATKAEINLVQLYVATEQYTEANALLSQLAGKTNPPGEFIELQELIMGIKSNPSTAFDTISKTANKTKLIEWAQSSDYCIEGASKALLALINEPVEEEKLAPDDGSGARFANQEPQITDVVELSDYVKVYPNPANDVLFVEMENNNSSLIEIRDITGKLVLTQNIEIKGSINVQSLQNGIYFINLVNGSNLISSKKIAIIK